MKKQYIFLGEQLCGTLLMLMFMGLIGFALWTSDKGLTHLDEGFYLVQAQYPHEMVAALSSYFYYTGPMFNLCDYNVVAFRILGLFLMVASVCVFYFGFLKMLELSGLTFPQTRFFRMGCLAFLGLGMFLYYSAYIQHRMTISYNMLNTVAVNSSVGLFFISLGCGKQVFGKWALSDILIIASGLFVGICFFTKFSTAILLLPMLVLCAAGINEDPRLWLRTLLLISLGVLIWLTFHFTFVRSPSDSWNLFSRHLVACPRAGLGHSLHKYFLESLDLLVTSFRLFRFPCITLILSFFVLTVSGKYVKNCKLLNMGMFLGVLGLGLMASYEKIFDLGSWGINVISLYSSWLLLLSCAAATTILFSWKIGQNIIKARASLFSLCVILFLCPFAAAIGTINNIQINLVLHLAPWFGLMVILLIIISQLHETQIVISLGMLIIGALVSAQVLYGAFNPAPPYQADRISRLTEPAEIGAPITSLKLDKQASMFYREIRSTARQNGFRAGDDILAFFDMPGVVYALGGKSPCLAWYFGNHRVGANDGLEYLLSLVDPERLKKAFILQYVDNQKLPDLTKLGLKFPEEYFCCGDFFFPGTNKKILFWKPCSSR